MERCMKKLVDDIPVSYRQEIGDGYYVSITTGFYCIDIRKFFIPHGKTEIVATRRGLALRLGEWANLRKIMVAIDNSHPTLATAMSCCSMMTT